MAARNTDSINPGGEFHASKPRDEPLTTQGHAAGVRVGNDAAPEFSAQTLPAGSAPPEKTHRPNPIDETPGQANNDDTLRSHGKESTYVSASSTLGGATSGDVHTGLGHPGQGQVSSDKDRNRSGLAGVGASGVASSGMGVDERLNPSQRGLERESGDLAGKKDTEPLGTEERVPESAETVAAERD